MSQPAMREILAEAQRRTAEHPFAVLVWVDEAGYPMHRPGSFEVEEDGIRLRISDEPLPPDGAPVAVILSRIRPRPQGGYEGRRYWTFHGSAHRRADGVAVRPHRVSGWREDERPFLALCEGAVPQAQRYFAFLSRIHGRPIRPRLPLVGLLLRATRAPFLTATVIPVLLGAAVAFYEGSFSLPWLVLTLAAAALVHLGLNVCNDIFDALSGADAVNPSPTPFSGGSRVIQYGLLGIREMALLCAALYGGGALLGLLMVIFRAGVPLLVLGALGLLLSIAYTAPPLRLAYRGLGELAVGLGFGPLMTIGAYMVQTGRIGWPPLIASVPVALLIALVLYVNEVPDRAGDAAAGKRTLAVRLSGRWRARIYGIGVAAAYLFVGIAVILRWMPPWTVAVGVTLPMAVSVGRSLARFAEQPYALIPAMATQIRLHLYAGLLLAASYLVSRWLGPGGS
jgi:1,4-dihydroxy-2-naphthoate octaprenyltransferase